MPAVWQQPPGPVHMVVVPHTHWDREWYQPFQEFRGRLVRLLDRLLDILDRDPAFTHFHLDGQTVVLEDYLEIRPDRRARLRQLIRDGRIAVGPWYVLPDEFLVSGESLVRNLCLGHRLATEFGAPAKIGYLPDEFGHAAQMPQILAGFGIDCAVVWRGVGADVTQTLFHWQGLDGTTVLTVYLPISGYSNGRNLPERADELRGLLATLIAEQATFRRIPSLLVMNGTDHQEPQAQLPTALAAAVRGCDGVTCEIAPLARFLERARQEHGELETHRGELRSPLRAVVVPGVTSVRVRLKQRDFENVSRLERYAEPLATWADLLDLPPSPPMKEAGKASRVRVKPTGNRLGDFLEWAWKLTVQNHPHDSITGCSVDQVHRDMHARFDQVQLVVEDVIRQALRGVTQQFDTSGIALDTPLLVFNPNGTGPNVVTADLHGDGTSAYVLADADGRQVPLHVETSASEVLLDAELPPAEVRPHVLAMQRRELLGLVVNDIRLERRDATLAVAVTLDRTPRGHLDLARQRAEWLAHLDDPTLRSVAVRAQTGVPARATFCAAELTGHGFTLFRLQRPGAAATRGPLRTAFAASHRELENEFFRVRVNDDASLHITDKLTGLALPRCNWFVDEGDRGDEYNFDPVEGQAVTTPGAQPAIAIAADNHVVATLTVTAPYELPHHLEADRETRSPARVPVPITTVARLYADVKRIDFETTLDNAAADHRLRVHFQTPLVVESALMEQAFGTVERLLALEPASGYERPVGTVPQKTFACIQDRTWGVALFNRGIPEVEVRRTETGTELALTLIRAVGWLSRGDLRFRRGPAGPRLETPEAQSPGQHRFAYALTTFTGDWHTAGIVAQAHAFAYPPLVSITDAHPGALPATAALVDCDNPHVVLSALTASRSARRRAVLARWYNSSAQPQTADIAMPAAVHARAVNFLEQPVRAAIQRRGAERWRVHFRPFEIVTLQLRTK